MTKNPKILYLHSNTSELLKQLHRSRVALYNQLGYDVQLFDSTEYFSPTIFPYLDRFWRKKDARLMRFYDVLTPQLQACDVLIHYNGANIHPRFLEQFRCTKVYHCADDPDASAILSRPVAAHYDVCAISNVACLDMYRKWGCKHVFFWPLGSSFPDEVFDSVPPAEPRQREVPVVFVGAKSGVPAFRFFGRLLGLYKRRRFMTEIERRVPQLVGYGQGWANGMLADAMLPRVYASSRLGLNKHNSLGPINSRLYDLPAFGVMQICDNKQHLGQVYELGKEVVGYDSLQECVELIEYYLAHPDEAQQIALAGQQRFRRDYAARPLWEGLLRNLGECLGNSGGNGVSG